LVISESKSTEIDDSTFKKLKSGAPEDSILYTPIKLENQYEREGGKTFFKYLKFKRINN